MENSLYMTPRRIISGRFGVGQRSFAVFDGYLIVKPTGFGLGGWSATEVVISSDPGHLAAAGAHGILEVEDDHGDRWSGCGSWAKTPASSSQLVKLDIASS
jgi:hypothetical protein